MTLKVDKNIYLILLAFITVHIFLYLKLGIVSSLEGEKYIKQADFLLTGKFPSAPKYYYYLPIILLIALSKSLSFGYGFVVLFQSLIASLALICFYRGTAIVIDRKSALLAALALCFFVPFHSWDFHIYSDSIFISLSLLLYYLICKFETQNLQYLVLLFLLLGIMVFTRPFGVLFIPPLFLYFLLIKYKNQSIKITTVITSVVFVIFMFYVIQNIFHGGEDMDAMKPFIEEHIICFVPNKPHGTQLSLKNYNNGVQDIFYYIIHNPLHFSKLMLLRLYSFFKFTRPWYSSLHNLFLTAFIVPVYFFFFMGVYRLSREKYYFFIFFVAAIFLYALGTTFQCDDWHSRFTMPVLPPIFAIAAYGFIFYVKKIS